MKILCKNNKGYKWYGADESYIRGYIQLNNNMVLKEKEAIQYFYESHNYDEFIEKLKSVYGLYSVIIQKEKETWIYRDSID